MDHDATNPYPQPGDVLAKKFRVDRLIGAGATGAVFQGWHVALDEKVSIKCLLPDLRHHPKVVERFVREARAAVRIKNVHVSRVMDVGKTATGVPFMVMEFLEGEDLERALEARGAIDPTRAVGYVLQACEAIAEAHSLGIVHRDLKPGNLFVSVDGAGTEVIKVLDFGVSKALLPADGATEKERSLTGTAMVGSPDYMSPEQIVSSRSVDTRADIWSIGVTLYQLVTGALPFDAADVADLFNAVVHDPPVPLRRRIPTAPARLEAILAKCLEKDPAQRHQTIADLASELIEFGPPEGRGSATAAANYIKRGEARLSGDFLVPCQRHEEFSASAPLADAPAAPADADATSATPRAATPGHAFVAPPPAPTPIPSSDVGPVSARRGVPLPIAIALVVAVAAAVVVAFLAKG